MFRCYCLFGVQRCNIMGWLISFNVFLSDLNFVKFTVLFVKDGLLERFIFVNYISLK